MRNRLFQFSRLEKVLFIIFGVLFLWGLSGALSIFYDENTISIPSTGGIYREGVVGDASNLVLNPVFVYGKRDRSIEADISSLLFAGLLKFDSKEGKLTDYLAIHTLSTDKKTYTFTLKDGLRWHDGVDLTADDVMFTFDTVIKHPDFSNEALKKAFEEVSIEKISDREVSFTIPYPYKFFLTNFTVGLLPKHILQDVPVSQMEYHEFSYAPIGNGPFKWKKIEELRRNIFQVQLEAFTKSSAFNPYLEGIEFNIYPSRNALSLDSEKLSGIRPYPQAYADELSISSHLKEKVFSLPQYSALFFNMKRPIFEGESGRKIRQGIQLATNKDALVNEIVPAIRIDTPLLETNTEDWLYEFTLEKANGALKDAGFFLPSSKPKTFTPERSESSAIQVPSSQNTWEGKRSDYNESFTLEGDYPLQVGSVKILINNTEVLSEEKPRLARKWSFEIPFTESFQDGTHEIRIQFIGFDEETIVEEDAISVYLEPVDVEEEREDKKYEIREDKDGNPLKLTLLTTKNPYYYEQVAQYIKEDFGRIGIDLEIKTLNMQSFLDSVRYREYDILLYGQNLGYNLDIYEFFHESQVGNDNLSDYQNPEASVLIEEIRSSHVQEIRSRKLAQLREILKNDIPAVFLFSPKYTYHYDPNIEGLEIDFIAFQKDRLAYIDKAYITKDKSFIEDTNWFDSISFLYKNFISFITISL